MYSRYPLRSVICMYTISHQIKNVKCTKWEIVCVGTLFAAALYVFGSPIVNMGIGLAYIGVSMPLAESVVPLLFRPNRMIDGFLLGYWVIHIGIQLALCVLLFAWQRRNAKYGGGYPRL